MPTLQHFPIDVLAVIWQMVPGGADRSALEASCRSFREASDRGPIYRLSILGPAEPRHFADRAQRWRRVRFVSISPTPKWGIGRDHAEALVASLPAGVVEELDVSLLSVMQPLLKVLLAHCGPSLRTLRIGTVSTPKSVNLVLPRVVMSALKPPLAALQRLELPFAPLEPDLFFSGYPQLTALTLRFTHAPPEPFDQTHLEACRSLATIGRILTSLTELDLVVTSYHNLPLPVALAHFRLTRLKIEARLDGITAWARANPQVISLELSLGNNTDEALCAVTRHCPLLERFVVLPMPPPTVCMRSRSIPRDDLLALAECCPRISELRLPCDPPPGEDVLRAFPTLRLYTFDADSNQDCLFDAFR
eukprot:TRINITY_DN17678_c0_g1_i1.p1 TRINITY_DN17678_c0_g1~~TRINITY_DN17678_c0_g1_i1.p1  ORF type:complete len:377 (+),score=45.71 TRINITY_DN17678_c0_g1_i1:43-1131(+)